ncbi:MAG: tetratricopeptide repeat protein [Pyrinomonadaceae bacterium]
MRFERTPAYLFVIFLLITSVVGQHHDMPSGDQKPANESLGEISFPTSGPAEAQKHFIRGVLLLHSFEYGRAKASFAEASSLAPDFAMAYWGEAMTYNHSIWGEQDRNAALTALKKLGSTPTERAAKTPTDREKLYLTAVECLYGEGTKTERDAAYSAALSDLSSRFPDDIEARAFYALSLLGLTNTTRSTENYMRAASVAEEIFAAHRDHPGALHYLIHAYDDPVHAPLGLRAARMYGTVAKGASHAQHMPSHIFFALGMWDDAISANIASMKTARDGGQKGYHPLHWLVHAYLQQGKSDDAARLIAIVETDIKNDPSAAARNYLALCRATWLVETRGTDLPGVLDPIDAAGIRSIVAFSGYDLAAGLEYVRRNDLAAARRASERIRQRIPVGEQVPPTDGVAASRYDNVDRSDVDMLMVMGRTLNAAIEFASGNKAAGVEKAIRAAEAEDKLVFEYGPPAMVKPAWEAAGDMLLKVGRTKDAAAAFQRVLKQYPNRKLSNDGLRTATAQAAK